MQRSGEGPLQEQEQPTQDSEDTIEFEETRTQRTFLQQVGERVQRFANYEEVSEIFEERVEEDGNVIASRIEVLRELIPLSAEEAERAQGEQLDRDRVKALINE